MTDAEKIAAFDVLAAALTNRWADGQWSWFCLSPCGGEMFATRPEAVDALVQWATNMAARNRKRFGDVPTERAG